MSQAYRPFGGGLTMAEAVAASGKSLRTVQRWIRDGRVRVLITSDGAKVSEVDIGAMNAHRWTRTPRLRHTA